VLDGLESNTVDGATATGRPDQPTAVTATSVTGDERRLAADLLNGVRVLMETEGRTSEQDDRGCTWCMPPGTTGNRWAPRPTDLAMIPGLPAAP
jgi:hypothetical protein